jgi:hypothetical protein
MNELQNIWNDIRNRNFVESYIVLAVGLVVLIADVCVIQAMPTIDSDGCRPPIPGRADHQFRRHGVHFFWHIGIGGRHRLDSVGGMLRNPGIHN